MCQTGPKFSLLSEEQAANRKKTLNNYQWLQLSTRISKVHSPHLLQQVMQTERSAFVKQKCWSQGPNILTVCIPN